MARGDSLTGEKWDPKTNPDGRRVVTLIGDASIVNGVAMEGLNNAGTLQRQFLIVLNDNGMSISHPQGALSQYFDRLRLSHLYADFKKGAHRVLKHVPGGSLLEEAYHKMGEATKAMIAEGAWFEHFGLVTVGPIDGHNIASLIEFLAEAREFDRPMVLHVKTVKGKGFDFSEDDATASAKSGIRRPTRTVGAWSRSSATPRSSTAWPWKGSTMRARFNASSSSSSTTTACRSRTRRARCLSTSIGCG